MMAARRILLEVCIASPDDAIAAHDAGADRLELNAALPLGGLTPSLGAIVETRAVSLPLIVMARPRPGGFDYSAGEWRVLRRDVELSLEHGADGVAFGALTESGEIDRERVREIVRQVGGKQAVFHRAFDVTPEPFAALEALIDLGVTRVLTSGQEETAYQGAALIRRLIERAAGRIEVLPASGVNRFSVADVVARTGCDQVHASLRTSIADRSTTARPQVRFGAAGGPPEDRYDATSAERVRQMRELLDAR
jgi:copper homeostasis protein